MRLIRLNEWGYWLAFVQIDDYCSFCTGVPAAFDQRYRIWIWRGLRGRKWLRKWQRKWSIIDNFSTVIDNFSTVNDNFSTVNDNFTVEHNWSLSKLHILWHRVFRWRMFRVDEKLLHNFSFHNYWNVWIYFRRVLLQQKVWHPKIRWFWEANWKSKLVEAC